MGGPITPKKQVRFIVPRQELTPPPTIKPKRLNSANPLEANPTQIQYGQTQPEQLYSLQESQEKIRELRGRQAIASQPEGTNKLPSTDGKTGSDITRWLYTPTSQEQHRQRLNSFLHSLYPSNDEFSKCFQPFSPSCLTLYPT